MKVLLTGSTGFIGRHLCFKIFQDKNKFVTAIYRNNQPLKADNTVQILSIDARTEWADVLRDQEVVIHAAARTHIMNDESFDTLSEYRRVNVDGTLNLARQAADTGVKRFIYISSIKVNGESTQPSKPFRFDNPPSPQDTYGVSKAEAETGLRKIGAETGMEIVIIRPPLVYGKGVKGNFASLVKLALKRVPLPLGGINNKRSMVSVQNLVDLIFTCIDHPNAANQIFLVSDDKDVSTSDLLRCLGVAANKPARLINFPAGVMRFIAKLFFEGSAVNRLIDSLQVDITHTKNTLNWSPTLTLEEGLKSCFESKDT